jgi:splicing factor 3B subunit 3
MFLYNLTLQKGGGVQCAVYGNFSAPKAQEIVVSRNKVLELLRPDESGKMQTIVSTEVFGVIRSLAAFRLTGANRDYLVCGSDSGRIVVLQYDKERNRFDKVHQETFGKSGCRRIVPGQFLCVDPKGRAIMIAAIEKAKLVYVLNRDTEANLTISSPLEANKSHVVAFHVAALDCGLDNPVFAAIELDYADADQDSTGEAAAEAQKHLTFYELDLGLNHVARKSSEPIDNGANHLIAVPGGGDGPGGVLVCAENFIIYKNQGHPDVRAVIPRRNALSGDRGVLIVSSATHRTKQQFFFLAQSEYGDIYKVTVEYQKGTEFVSEVKIKYFDTIPPCVSICVLKTGFLFAASEFGNHALYQFQGIGDDEDDVESSSATLVETDEGYQPVFFEPRALRNLHPIDDVESLCPVLDMQCHNLVAEETPQLYALCGTGPRSTLRVLRQGVALSEMAVSPLPGNPNAVFTVRKSVNDEFDAYIVVSFTNATLMLSIGETVEEVSDSGFLGTVPTLSASLLGDDSLLQVHPGGLRHIRADKRINEWRTPGRKTVTRVTTNARQVIIALSGGELIYFELDQTGQLMEVEKLETSGDVACLAIGPVPEGHLRNRFLAVGSFDSTVRILSLGAEDCLQTMGVQALAAAPNSLLMLRDDGSGSIYLNVGLTNGVLLRADVDSVTGQLSDTRARFLGARPPKLSAVSVQGKAAMMALSSRPWLGHFDLANRFALSPLSYEPLEHAAPFSSDACPEGVVAVAGNTLRIVAVERLGEQFNQRTCKLRYTPRQMSVNVDRNTLAVVECDQSSVPYDERTGLEGAAGEKDTKMDVEGEEDEEEDEVIMTPAEQFGAPKAPPGSWASCVRIVDPASASTKQIVEMMGNEAALCCCHVYFPQADELFLAVGTAVSLTFSPRDSEGGFIHLYRYTQDGGIELFHKTPLDGVPGAMCGFKGRLLVGVGNTLRLYDFGKKKLLRKVENRNFPNFIKTIHAQGERIYVGDVQESFHYVRYKREDGSMYIVADDVQPRHVTAACPLDYDTIAGGDRFGNVFVSRLAQDVSDEIEEDPTGGKTVYGQGALNGASHKINQVTQFHVGETVCALTKGTLQAGGLESMIYATLMGTLGALMPFGNREDVDFCTHLEMHMRQELPPLLGRDHLAFRSSYFPVKDVIDGDLCEMYTVLPHEAQRRVAEDMDRTVSEVLKKLEDLRAKVA